MKKRNSNYVKKLAMYLLLLSNVLFFNCTTISLTSPILNEQNSDNTFIPHTYWLEYSTTSTTPIDAYEIRNLNEYQGKARGRNWVGISANKNNGFSFRYKSTKKKGTYIGQFTSYDANTIKISLIVVDAANQYTVYAPNSSFLKKIKTSVYLSGIRNHYTVSGYSIVFDNYACKYYGDKIIAFMESLDTKTDFMVYRRYKATTNKALVNRVWARNKIKTNTIPSKTNQQKQIFHKKYQIGDVMSLDTGWGVLGYQDIVITATDYYASKQVKVKNIQDSSVEWVYSSNLMSRRDALNKVYNTTYKTLELLFNN